jgi:cell division septal protein FtsQ
MEIKTSNKADEYVETAANPDKSRYLRRKATQKLRKSHSAGRFLGSALRFTGKLIAVLAVLGLGTSIFVFAYSSEMFTLRQVTCHGCGHVDPARLENIIRDTFPSHILHINLVKLRTRLEQETWIRRAEIRRRLPGDLILYVVERSPSVILEVDGDLMLADQEGILLDRYDPKYGKLDVPVFKGVLGDSADGYRLYQQENSDRVTLGLKLLSELDRGSPDFARSVSEVDISEKSNLRITLVDDAAEVNIGDRDFLKRFRILMANLPQYRELKTRYEEIASVDLRFDGQIIYRPRQASDSSDKVEVMPH